MSFCDNYTLTRTFTGSRDANTQGGKAVSFIKRLCDTAEIKKETQLLGALRATETG